MNTSSRRMRKTRGKLLADDSRYPHCLRVGRVLKPLHSKRKTRQKSKPSEQRRLFHPKKMLHQVSRRRERRSGKGTRWKIRIGASHSSPHNIVFLLYYLMSDNGVHPLYLFHTPSAFARSGKYKHCVLFPTTTSRGRG